VSTSLVASTFEATQEKLAALEKMGIEVLTIPPDSASRVDLQALLKTLARRQISSLLVEGGAEVITSFLRLSLADKLVVIIAPKLTGSGTAALTDFNIADLSQALELPFTRVYRSGVDIVIEGKRTVL